MYLQKKIVVCVCYVFHEFSSFIGSRELDIGTLVFYFI